MGGTNDDLIERLRDSDRGAFDEVYREFYLLLVNYASLMVSRETAEDIVHDVFIGLWTNRRSLAPVSSSGGGILRPGF